MIKGSERVTGWDQVSGDVWTVAMPNSLFGFFDPFAEEIDGDSIVFSDKWRRRGTWAISTSTGPSFYQVLTLPHVSDPPFRREVIDDWTRTVDRIRDPEQTRSPGTPKSEPYRQGYGRTSRARIRPRTSLRSTYGARSSTRSSTT